MTRIFSGRFLTIALLLAFACFSVATALQAAGWFGGDDPVGTTTPPDDPPGGVVIDLNPTETAPRVAIPTRQLIYQLIEQDKFVEAEEAYAVLVNSWGEDDNELLAALTLTALQQQSSAGDEKALMALLQAGDQSTMSLIRQQLRSGETTLTKDNHLSAIRLIGINRRAVDYPLLVGLLKNDDPQVVNTAIEALGYMGQEKGIAELLTLVAEADPLRSVLIVQAIINIGGRDEMRERYFSQTDFPMIVIPERAAMLLALVGDTRRWELLKTIIDEKWPKYYPLALSTLGHIKKAEAAEYVTAALQGTADEQAAALQSINALTPELKFSTLVGLIKDEKNSETIRLEALSLLTDIPTIEAENELLDAAFKRNDADPLIAPAAIMALQQRGALNNSIVRTKVRRQLSNENPDIQRAARTALYSYAKEK